MQSSSPVLDFLSSNFILAGGKVEPQPEVFLLNTTLPFSLPNFEKPRFGSAPHSTARRLLSMATTRTTRLSNCLSSLRLVSRPHTSARSKELSQQNGVALLANRVYVQPARAGGRPAGQ